MLSMRAFVLVAALLPAHLVAQETFGPTKGPRTVHRAAGFDIEVIGELKGFTLDFTPRVLEPGVEVVTLKLSRAQAEVPPKLNLKWAIPSHDVAGQWMTGRDI